MTTAQKNELGSYIRVGLPASILAFILLRFLHRGKRIDAQELSLWYVKTRRAAQVGDPKAREKLRAANRRIREIRDRALSGSPDDVRFMEYLKKHGITETDFNL